MATSAIVAASADSANSAPGPEAPSTSPADKEPISALALLQCPTQRLALMRSSAERAMSGNRAAPVGGMLNAPARPMTTKAATTGEGASRATLTVAPR